MEKAREGKRRGNEESGGETREGRKQGMGEGKEREKTREGRRRVSPIRSIH
jgi:hypothetical protein